MPTYSGHIDYIWKIIFYEQTPNQITEIIQYTGSSVYIPRIHESVTILENIYHVIDVCYNYDEGIIEIKTLKTN